MTFNKDPVKFLRALTKIKIKDTRHKNIRNKRDIRISNS